MTTADNALIDAAIMQIDAVMNGATAGAVELPAFEECLMGEMRAIIRKLLVQVAAQ